MPSPVAQLIPKIWNPLRKTQNCRMIGWLWRRGCQEFSWKRIRRDFFCKNERAWTFSPNREWREFLFWQNRRDWDIFWRKKMGQVLLWRTKGGGRDFLRGHEKWPIFTYILRRSLGKWSQDKALKLPVVPFKISLFPFSHRCYWILAVNPVLSNFDPGWHPGWSSIQW